MPDKQFQFFNYPKPLSLAEFQACHQQVLRYLKVNFPSCSIFQVGGNQIQPGISDVDFLLVNDGPINGNKLYLREFPLKCRNRGVLVHEPFAIDLATFRWISRLSTYRLKLAAKGKTIADTSLILDDQPIYKLVKLAMYTVVNYPMNFRSGMEGNRVNIRRTLAKLKKLLQVDDLCKETFNGSGFLDRQFAHEIVELNEGFTGMTKQELGEELIQFVEKGNKEVIRFFEVYQEESKKIFGMALPDSGLTVGNCVIRFSENWLNKQKEIGTYYLPNNFGVINQLLNNINSDYLQNITPGGLALDVAEIDELATVWNNYLKFCDQNNILTLITDMNFSVMGHDSLKYRLYSKLGKLKKIF